MFVVDALSSGSYSDIYRRFAEKPPLPKTTTDASTDPERIKNPLYFRVKCIGMFFMTPLAAVANTIVRLAKILSFAHFWMPKEGKENDGLKGRLSDAGKDLLRVLSAPVAIPALQIVALSGIVIGSKRAKPIILKLENLFYGAHSECAAEKKVETDESLVDPLSNPSSVVLYMSITGNPTHLGHMAAVATSIDVLLKQKIPVAEAKISLSDEPYHRSKVKRSVSQGIKKIALSQTAREHLLLGAINEAVRRNMFKGVKVSYWNDQEEGDCDHPKSYLRLKQSLEKTARVYLVGGMDLCKNMRNWPSLDDAIVVQRELDNGDVSIPSTPKGKNRIYIESLYPEFKQLSSSAIQDGSMKLEPSELQDYFEEQCRLAL